MKPSRSSSRSTRSTRSMPFGALRDLLSDHEDSNVDEVAVLARLKRLEEAVEQDRTSESFLANSCDAT